MSLPALSIIPAGAGSGKTYSIEVQLGEWVEQGLVAPERIVAVTFTEAAAAELKERIGTKLLSMGRVEDALKLEQAYISTIHGFGLRLLTEFAFESGSSPQPRLLERGRAGGTHPARGVAHRARERDHREPGGVRVPVRVRVREGARGSVQGRPAQDRGVAALGRVAIDVQRVCRAGGCVHRRALWTDRGCGRFEQGAPPKCRGAARGVSGQPRARVWLE